MADFCMLKIGRKFSLLKKYARFGLSFSFIQVIAPTTRLSNVGSRGVIYYNIYQ